jgi:hypothetical protein
MRLKTLILRSELTYILRLILLNYQPIIVQIGLNDSSTIPTRKSTRDYILNVLSIELL